MKQARTRMTVVTAVASFLATLTLWPLLETQRWPYAAFLVIVLMAAVGWLTRRLRVPGVLAPFAYALVLLVALTAMYAQDTALFLLLPTPASLDALRDLLVSAFIDVRRYATPAPETPPLMLLTVGGVGVVAALVDFIAVRLRQPGAAGLPMLALYSVAAGILTEGPGWIPFTFGAAGFLAMLLTDNRERLERWGRPVIVRRSWDKRPAKVTRQIADTAPLASLGRRLGIVAILVAILVPVLVPLTDQSFASGTGSGSSWLRRFGAPTLRAPDPVVSMRRTLLRQSDEVMFTYRTTASQPDYLRTVALSEFDGETWRPGRLRGYDEYTVRRDTSLPVPTGSDPTITQTVTTRVAVNDRVSLTFLPAPYAPTQVDAGAGWYYEPSTLTVFAPKDSARGLRYAVISDVPRPRPPQLDSAGDPNTSVSIRANLDVPRDLPAEVRTRTNELTKGKKSRYAKALALQEWFTDTGGFTYSTEPGGNGGNALREFLRDKRGYCEQYASAMALMARIAGIPSRVAVGFTQGTVRGDEWVVRGRDAHAWPELWFEGVGWVRFEPTPSGGFGQGSAEVPRYTDPNALNRANDPGDDQTQETSTSTDDGSGAATARQRPEPTMDQTTGGGEGTTPGWRVWLGIAVTLLALALVLLVPAFVRVLVRRRRWHRARDPVAIAHAAWSELRDDAGDLGFSFRGSESPRAAAARLTRRLAADPPTTDAIQRIAMAEELARYAPRADTPDDLRADVRRARRALLKRVSFSTRVTGVLLPASVLTVAGRVTRPRPPDDPTPPRPRREPATHR